MIVHNLIIRWKRCGVSFWAGLYFLMAFPAAFLFPPWAGWENGPLEMLQNIVLAAGAVCCIALFRKARGCYHHSLCLAISL